MGASSANGYVKFLLLPSASLAPYLTLFPLMLRFTVLPLINTREKMPSFLSPSPVSHLIKHIRATKNLETCTENLGCETGAVWDLEKDSILGTKRGKAAKEGRKKRNSGDFPPPITTLGGEGRLRLQKQREKGRLILIAFKPLLLEAERCDGRLLLRVLPSGAVKMAEGEREEKEELGKYRRAGRCKEDEAGVGIKKMPGAAIFEFDSFWVAST